MEPTDSEKIKSIDRLIAAVDKAYHHPGQLAMRGFFLGLMSGLGATVGVAIVIGVMGLLIRQFGGLPIVGEWLNDLGRALQSR